jgi:hypothetical protein
LSDHPNRSTTEGARCGHLVTALASFLHEHFPSRQIHIRRGGPPPPPTPPPVTQL